MIDQVTIRPIEPKGPALVFELLEDDVVDGQVGGWESLARPRRAPAAGWVGLPETTLTLPLMLDGYAAQRSIERQCQSVVAWGRPGEKTFEPPKLQVTGPLLVSKTSVWVLQQISWGARIRDRQGRRVQQEMTLTLLQYLEPRLIVSPARTQRDKK